MNPKVKQEVIQRLETMRDGYKRVINERQGNIIQRKGIKIDLKRLEKLILEVKLQ